MSYRPGVKRATAEEIKAALVEKNGYGNQAIHVLGVSLRTLRRWMIEDGLQDFAKNLRKQHEAAARAEKARTERSIRAPRLAREPRVRAERRLPHEPRPPKPRVDVNPFHQGPKLGPKPKHNVKESDPLATRSVTNRELRALGHWR